jgi:hypothetical protein
LGSDECANRDGSAITDSDEGDSSVRDGAKSSATPAMTRAYGAKKSRNSSAGCVFWSRGSCFEPQTARRIRFFGALSCKHPGSDAQSVIRKIRTHDGTRWQDPDYVVASKIQRDRPGTPVTRRLADGRWMMTYELCGPARCFVLHRGTRDSGVGIRVGLDGSRVLFLLRRASRQRRDALCPGRMRRENSWITEFFQVVSDLNP